jgi:hypothetical protein
MLKQDGLERDDEDYSSDDGMERHKRRNLEEPCTTLDSEEEELGCIMQVGDDEGEYDDEHDDEEGYDEPEEDEGHCLDGVCLRIACIAILIEMHR